MFTEEGETATITKKIGPFNLKLVQENGEWKTASATMEHPGFTYPVALGTYQEALDLFLECAEWLRVKTIPESRISA